MSPFREIKVYLAADIRAAVRQRAHPLPVAHRDQRKTESTDSSNGLPLDVRKTMQKVRRGHHKKETRTPLPPSPPKKKNSKQTSKNTKKNPPPKKKPKKNQTIKRQFTTQNIENRADEMD